MSTFERLCVCAYVCMCVCVCFPELEGCVGRSVLCRYKLIYRIQKLYAGESCVLCTFLWKKVKLFIAVCVCVCVWCVYESEYGGKREREREIERETGMALQEIYVCFHTDQKMTTVVLPRWLKVICFMIQTVIWNRWLLVQSWPQSVYEHFIYYAMCVKPLFMHEKRQWERCGTMGVRWRGGWREDITHTRARTHTHTHTGFRNCSYPKMTNPSLSWQAVQQFSIFITMWFTGQVLAAYNRLVMDGSH